MPGQPEGQFDVTKLDAIETDGITQTVSRIFDVGEALLLRATFDGSGAGWDAMEALGAIAQVNFYAEGMGPFVWNQAFGPAVPQPLAPAGGPYQVIGGPFTIPDPPGPGTGAGIYRCGVIVSFQNAAGAPVPGWVGFNEDCVIQVHPSEA